MSCPVNLRALPTGVFEEVFTPENIRGRSMTTSLSTLSFPKSRCALWDGTPTGDKVLLHLCAHRPPCVQLLEKTLRLAQRHVRHRSKSVLYCFFLGSLSVDSDEEGVTVTLDRFDPGRDQNGVCVPSTVLPGDMLVPCVFTSDPSTEALGQSECELHHTFKLLQQSISGRQSIDLAQILRLRVHIVCSQCSDQSDFNLTWTCVSPATSVHIEAVRAVHVIPTALLRSLTSPVRPTGGSNRQKGFVTMDQTRKLLLLLESDPKALSLPLVGLWYSGATQVHSPQIWAWILRFFYSSSMQDRVLSESGCFLLLLFGSTHRAPQFYQCKVRGSGLDYQLLTGHHNTTLYQQVATVEGQTLKCDLSSEPNSRQTEVFRQAQRSFSSAPAMGLSVTDQDSGVEDEDLSPRPSPSPHLPQQQARRIQPSVPELSLLIDCSFSSSHDPAPASSSRPQVPLPPPTDRKSTPPVHLHSTPHSNLLQPNCTCCNSQNYNCTSIHATPGPNQMQIHQKTLQNYKQTTANSQNGHHTPKNTHSSPLSHRQNPSNRDTSLPEQPQIQPILLSYQHSTVPPASNLQYVSTSSPNHLQSPSQRRQSLTEYPQSQTILQNYQHTNLPIPNSYHQATPQPASSQQHPSTHAPSHHQMSIMPVQTTNVHQSFHPSFTNVPQNHNRTMEQLKMAQLQQNPVLNLFQTAPNVGKMHQTGTSLNTSHVPVEHSPPNGSQMTSSHTNMNLSNFPSPSQHNSPSQAASLLNPSPIVMSPSCPYSQPIAFPALPTPPVACVNPCCEQQGALSSGEAFQLLLQQDKQLRLLQQQVQMLLEAQGKLQSTQQQTETQTKSTASIAVSTGASLFWPEPPTLHRDSSPSMPPCSDTPLSPCHCSTTSVEGADSPPHSGSSPLSESHDSGLVSHDQCEIRAKASCSPPPSQNCLSNVDSPVLGESASMYSPQKDQSSFYHNLMTQLNSRLRESEEESPKWEEKLRRRSLPDHPPPSPASHSSSLSSPSIPAAAPVSVQKKKPSRPSENPVMSATLRRLQQLGVNVDQQDLSEPERARAKAVESASTLACINPAAVLSRLSVSDPGLVQDPGLNLVFPHSSVDLSLEANAIALRYLSDQQLTRLSQNTPQKTPKISKSPNDITILSPNMSLATRKYMKRYGLIEEEDSDYDEQEVVPKPLLPQSQLIRELKPKMEALAQNGRGGGDGDKENTRLTKRLVENQGSVGNILDLSRLRQLPKLF